MLLNRINKIEIRSLAPWEMKIFFLNSLYSEIKFPSIFNKNFGESIFDILMAKKLSSNFEKIPPSFEKKTEPVEEVKEERKLTSCYLIKPDVSFQIFNDGYMEMEYRGEGPTDPEDPGISVRRERILPDTERYKEILEITKEMLPSKFWDFCEGVTVYTPKGE